MSTIPSPPAAALPTASPDQLWWWRWRQSISASRARRVICIVLSIWLLNFFDLALTLLAHEQGMLQEQNPVARGLLQDGPIFLILYKIGLVLVGSYPLLRFRSRRVTELGAFIVLIAYISLSFHWSECYELYNIALTGTYSMADLELLIKVGFN